MITTYRYIVENPVRAELVKKSDDYEHNGITFIKKGIFDIIEPLPYFLASLF